MIEGRSPVDPVTGPRMVESAESKPAAEVVAEPSPTVVVSEITTVFTEVPDSPVESALEPEVVGCNGERRLSKKFPVVPAEGVWLLLPVIPPKKSDNERLVEDEEEDSEVTSGVKLVIVEFTKS
jgi:hypothetical protein